MNHDSKQPRKTHRPYRVRAPWQDNVLSLAAILSLLVLTLAAVVLVFRLLMWSGILSQEIFTPENPASTPQPSAADGYDMLLPAEDGGSDSASIIRFSGDFYVLRSLLSDDAVRDNYCAEYETVLYAESGEHRSAVRVYAAGDCWRVELWADTATADAPDEIILCDGTAVCYTDNTEKETAVFPVTERFDMASFAGIPSAASYTDTAEAQTVSASCTELDGKVVYYVRFYVPTANGDNDADRIMQEYWISPTDELVLRCRTYEAAPQDTDAPVVYSCILKEMRELTAAETETLFVLAEETAGA
ncbi:MAG: hypothetical protein IJ449_08395 [Clostridia bacterium]|nr:hypothetical protein [Clostridia bacterium]